MSRMPFVGTTGVRTSPLVFGTMSFGGDADEAQSRRLYARCRDAGIHHFDTADLYNSGRSEEILGALVRPHRDEVILATKAYFPTGDGPNERGSSRLHLVRTVEASLRRLGTDRVDILYLHRFDEHTALEETLRAVEHLVHTGKVLYPAVSNFAAWQAMKALGIARQQGWAPIAAMQPMYNLVKRQAEVEILPMAKSEGLAIFPYSPLGGGLLTGKYGRERRPESGRVRDHPVYQTRYGDDASLAIAERFTDLAAELGHHPVTLAIAWVASHPAVTSPILGARNVEQLEPALDAATLELDAETRDRITALSPTPPPATDRNEEAAGLGFGTR